MAAAFCTYLSDLLNNLFTNVTFFQARPIRFMVWTNTRSRLTTWTTSSEILVSDLEEASEHTCFWLQTLIQWTTRALPLNDGTLWVRNLIPEQNRQRALLLWKANSPLMMIFSESTRSVVAVQVLTGCGSRWLFYALRTGYWNWNVFCMTLISSTHHSSRIIYLLFALHCLNHSCLYQNKLGLDCLCFHLHRSIFSTVDSCYLRYSIVLRVSACHFHFHLTVKHVPFTSKK